MQLTISTNQRIINSLLLNASFIENLGLMHGKMGISICFFHLARQTGNQIYEDYAGELIDEIYEEITANTPVDFENGLAGIGWGIEYLVQNKFIEADTDKILEEFDEKLLHEFTFHFNDSINLLHGLAGFIVYFAMRLCNISEGRTTPQLIIDTFKILLSEFLKQIPLLIVNYSKNQLHITKETTAIKETKEIGLTDLYTLPVLLISLSDIHVPGSTSFKNELISALSENFKAPESLFYRILLLVALKELQSEDQGLLQGKNSDLANNLIEKLRKLVAEEIPGGPEPNSFQLLNGTAGIALLYQLLYCIGQNPEYLGKSCLWLEKTMRRQSSEESVFAGFNPGEENIGFGLANGIAGLILANSFIPDNLTSNIATHD